MEDKIVYVPLSSIKERLKGLNAAIKNAPHASEWQKGRRDMLKDILSDYPQKSTSELLKEKMQEKDEQIKELVESLEQIQNMKLNAGENSYEYAFNRMWHIAHNILQNTIQ